MALAPNCPTNPYIYVLYAYDAPIGGTAPTWNDACPTPPGPTTDGCLVSARVSRLQISGNALTPPGAEGGALRSQSVRRTDGPATLDGAVLRIDPATGAGVAGNPFFSSPNANARRI